MLEQISVLPRALGRPVGAEQHCVQVYERGRFPAGSVGHFLGDSLFQGHAAVLIGTPEHTKLILGDLRRRGFSVERLIEGGRLVLFDAESTLSKILHHGVPSPSLFRSVVWEPAQEVRREFGGLSAFGEMVDLLWQWRRFQGALQLEDLWNEVCHQQGFRLLCAYEKTALLGLSSVCAIHDHSVWEAACYCGEKRSEEQAFEVLTAKDNSITLRGLRFFNLLPVGMMVCDRDGQILFSNDRAHELWGKVPEAKDRFTGALRLFNREGEEIPLEQCPVAACLRGGDEVKSQELLEERSDGTRLNLQSTVAPLRDEKGHLWGAVSIFEDISDRKRGEAQLQRRTDELTRSNSELAQFARVTSHDIKEPLRMIRIFSQVLAKKLQGELDPETMTALDIVSRSSKQVSDLIDALLTYSSLGSYAVRQSFDTNAALDVALDSLSALFVEREAVVNRDRLPTINGNPSLFAQLFQNLLSNAIKFNKSKRPQVNVTVTEDATGWIFSVADNGIGIDPAFFERVFVLYQRLQTTYAGTGVGLATCKKIVEWHGGNIWVESKEGEGTQVRFRIPRGE